MTIHSSNPEVEALTVSIETAAKLLGIGRTLAYESARRGDLRTVRVGRRLLVPLTAIAELLDNRTSPIPMQ